MSLLFWSLQTSVALFNVRTAEYTLQKVVKIFKEKNKLEQFRLQLSDVWTVEEASFQRNPERKKLVIDGTSLFFYISS